MPHPGDARGLPAPGAPTAPPTAPAVAALVPSTPRSIWEAVLVRIADRPSMSWVKHLELHQLDGSQARLLAISGGRELVQFVAGPRRQQLADLLQQIIGRPVRIEIESPAGPEGHAGEAIPQGIPATGRPPRSPAGRTTAAASDWQKALANPLVKQVMEVFDASVVSMGPESLPASGEVASAPIAPEARPVPELFPTQVPAHQKESLGDHGTDDLTDLAQIVEDLESPEDQDNV